jgi:CMP-N,N'-diacetyllegionaminic acid synthase
MLSANQRVMNILGLIPARSGSTGVPGKNIRPLAGKPLLAHTVTAARSSRLSRLILSTDSADYAEIGRQGGAEVPFLRPAELAQTETPAIKVIEHCLDFLDRNESWAPDAVFYLQPTSPFRRGNHIDQGIEKLKTEKVDSVVSVYPPRAHPYYMFVPNNSGRLSHLIDVKPRPERRQDLPPVYSLNDAIIGSRTDYLRAAIPRGGLVVNLDNFSPLSIEFPTTVDINTEQDFLFAEFIAAAQSHLLL